MKKLLLRLFRNHHGKTKHFKPVFIDLSGKRVSDEEYNRICSQQQQIAMDILKKISSQGEQSLSQDEKEFLDKFSHSSYSHQASNLT